jgi:hypothetical protein
VVTVTLRRYDYYLAQILALRPGVAFNRTNATLGPGSCAAVRLRRRSYSADAPLRAAQQGRDNYLGVPVIGKFSTARSVRICG